MAGLGGGGTVWVAAGVAGWGPLAALAEWGWAKWFGFGRGGRGRGRGGLR